MLILQQYYISIFVCDKIYVILSDRQFYYVEQNNLFIQLYLI